VLSAQKSLPASPPPETKHKRSHSSGKIPLPSRFEAWKKISLLNLKRDEELQKKLRKEVLLTNLDAIEEFVDSGVAPVFGFAPICFSPKEAKHYWQILIKPVL
jgi:hypothetical protein